MLNNTIPNHPTFGRRPERRPILAVDPSTNAVYDVASFIQELNNPEYQKESLAEKLDLFIRLSLKWADDSAEVSTIREMLEVMFRLRDAVADIKVTCNE